MAQSNSLTEPLASRPSADYGAAAVGDSDAAAIHPAATDSESQPVPGALNEPLSRRLSHSSLLTINDSLAHGDAASVGEEHLSYLCRAWEVNQLHPKYAADSDKTIGGVVTRVDTDYRDPVKLLCLSAPAVLLAFQGSLFVACFYFSTEMLRFSAASAAPLSLFIAHFVTWMVVLTLSGGVMYRSYSLVDGLNTITRFTLKLSIPEHGRAVSFVQSNMASSISSTVSTRGSTLNKLMIGACFSLGLGLFLKFMTLPDTDRSWKTDLAAFGYILIILTGDYENRTFDLEDSVRKDGKSLDIRHQRMNQPTLRRLHQGPMTPLTQKPQPVYNHLHLLGVVGFVGLPCISFIASYPQHGASLVLSLISIVLGLAFYLLDSALMAEKQTSWVSRPTTSKTTNILRGLSCIAIEFSCLACAAIAGIVY